MQSACLFLVFLGVCCINSGIAEVCDIKHVTVDELKHIVIGRCFDFQTTVHPEQFCTTGLKNCTELWEKFFTAFTDKQQCNVTADLYTDFIQAANNTVTGKQLFYSKLYGFAQRYSSGGARYTTLDDTLIGYLITGTSFCGGSAGENASENCERYNPVTCPYTASGSFWEAASVNFARNAVGHVYVLLTASRDPILKNTSFFTKYELPNLRSTVTQLTAILINDSPSSKRDPCKNEQSLQMLRALVEEKNIAYDCEQNPNDLVYLHCMDNPNTELCQKADLFQVSKSSSVLGNFYQLCFVMIVVVLNTFP